MVSTVDSRPHNEGRALVTFFFLAYAIMWACFFTVAFAVSPKTIGGQALLLLGAFAPGISAVWLSTRTLGKSGVKALLQPILKWQVKARWYVFALVFIVAIKITAAIIHRVVTGFWPTFGTEGPLVILAAILISTPFQAGEEVGWRGFALPKLAARFGLRGASVVLGVIWACWHIPQFFIHQSDTYGQSFSLYALQVIALSVAIAWLWVKTNCGLLLPMLFHSAFNNSKDIVPSALQGATNSLTLHGSLIGWVTVALLWLCAGYFLLKMPNPYVVGPIAPYHV